jgi:staphylococcal nuclease domain-containing protein 1
MWAEFDEEAQKAADAAAAAAASSDGAPLKPEYMDIIISDIRPSPSLTFSVQILNTEGTPQTLFPGLPAAYARPQGSRLSKS